MTASPFDRHAVIDEPDLPPLMVADYDWAITGSPDGEIRMFIEQGVDYRGLVAALREMADRLDRHARGER